MSILAMIATIMFGYPKYKVWQQTSLNNKAVIFIPTEGNQPILEAGRNSANR